MTTLPYFHFSTFDWACYDGDDNHESPFQIDCSYTEECGYDGIYDKNFEPIPLTLDIIQKNFGFEIEKMYACLNPIVTIFSYERGRENAYIICKLYDTNNGFGYSNQIPIQYVHQFQQLLRLLGHHKLANEFKI